MLNPHPPPYDDRSSIICFQSLSRFTERTVQTPISPYQELVPGKTGVPYKPLQTYKWNTDLNKIYVKVDVQEIRRVVGTLCVY